MARSPSLLLALLLLASCGDAPGPVPVDPVDEALAWLEGDCAETARWIAHPVMGELVAMDGEAVQERLTLCLREGLASGRWPLTDASYRGLDRWFGGRGRTEDGLLSAEAVREAVYDGALDAARHGRMDALAAAEAMAPEGDPRLAGTRAWHTLEEASALAPDVRAAGGPRVLVFADDFLLGEAPLRGALARWAETPELRVGVIPLLRGEIRVGIRRKPATEAEELESIRARLDETRIALEDFRANAAWALGRLGLEEGEGAILVIARSGRVVARRAGLLDDLSSLEPWVQKAASR